MKTDDRLLPPGYWRIDAVTNGYQIVVFGTPLGVDDGIPEDSPDSHNCDVMGCGSLDHVIYKIEIRNRPTIEMYPVNNIPEYFEELERKMKNENTT